MEFQFSTYDSEAERSVGDERVRAFVGERLAELPTVEIDSLSSDQRALYDRVLLRCEFANEHVISKFAHSATPLSIAKTREADLEVVAAARELENWDAANLDGTLRRLESAFDMRDKAMLGE
jgi:hypothetical protein